MNEDRQQTICASEDFNGNFGERRNGEGFLLLPNIDSGLDLRDQPARDRVDRSLITPLIGQILVISRGGSGPVMNRFGWRGYVPCEILLV